MFVPVIASSFTLSAADRNPATELVAAACSAPPARLPCAVSSNRAAGSVPAVRSAADPLVVEVVRAYMREAPLTDSDDALLGVMLSELAGVRVSGITYRWADALVASLKAKRRLAPGSIRKRVGALARVMDWHLRRATPAGVAPVRQHCGR